MPYITQKNREILDPTNTLRLALKPGELNFQISRLINRYLAGSAVNYTRINEVVGVLECAKLELYRRIAAPYENQKCSENGDVYMVVPDAAD